MAPQVRLYDPGVEGIGRHASAWKKLIFTAQVLFGLTQQAQKGGAGAAQTFQPLSQRAGEEHVGQFALRVRFPLVVALLAVDVVQVDGAPAVSHGRHVDDPGRSRPLNQVQQQMRQQEVTCGDRGHF